MLKYNLFSNIFSLFSVQFFQYILNNYQLFTFQVKFKAVVLKFRSGLKDLYKLFWREFVSLNTESFSA